MHMLWPYSMTIAIEEMTSDAFCFQTPKKHVHPTSAVFLLSDHPDQTGSAHRWMATPQADLLHVVPCLNGDMAQHPSDHGLTASAQWSDFDNNPLDLRRWIGVGEVAGLCSIKRAQTKLILSSIFALLTVILKCIFTALVCDSQKHILIA